ncbi:MAG: hypothetical protein LCH51_03140 [Bacteroidetes bacterium]|nr:hypothetical protein [Bacteroidota bacterium]
MRRIFLLHFSPIELYPPAVNLLRFIGEKGRGNKVMVSTSKMDSDQRAKSFRSDEANITVYRPGGKKNGPIKYAIYNIYSFALLLRHRPSVVLYYETISALPAIFYKRIFRSTTLMAHYHEYVSPDEYKTGMKLVRWAHRLEQKNYNLFNWISHTNADRLRLFIEDEKVGVELKRKTHIFPNYPPRSWHSELKYPENAVVRMVYVGALSLETTYLAEIVKWVIGSSGKFTLDLYSNNYPESTKQFLSSLDSEFVQFKGSVEYDDLPRTLSNYHVGLVLYKGHIPNYIYNIPNKVFEYIAVGLAVWYPKQMTSCNILFEGDNLSNVMPLDFDKLSEVEYSVKQLTSSAKVRSFYFEDVSEEVVDFIEKHS